MTLQVDRFSDEIATLISQGWVITDYNRYDPTTMAGLTPSGKAFTASAVRQGASGALVTLTIAGNTRTTSLASWDVDCEPSDKTAQQLRVTYLKFPAGQR